MGKPILTFTLVFMMFAMVFLSLATRSDVSAQVSPFALVAAATTIALGLASTPGEHDASKAILGFVLCLMFAGMIFFSLAASPHAWHSAPFALVGGSAAIGIGLAARRNPSDGAQSGLGCVLVLAVFAMLFFALMATTKYRWHTAPFGVLAAASAIGLGLASGRSPARGY